MKKLHVYDVYCDDGVSCIKVTIPAERKTFGVLSQHREAFVKPFVKLHLNSPIELSEMR